MNLLLLLTTSLPSSTVFCQIPCLNGGRCIGRDQCWCPSNATGKFCHLPAPVPTKPSTQGHKDAGHQGQKPHSHSMYTLPLSNQQGKLPVGPVWQPLLPCWCGIELESSIVASGEALGCNLPARLLSYLPNALNIYKLGCLLLMNPLDKLHCLDYCLWDKFCCISVISPHTDSCRLFHFKLDCAQAHPMSLKTAYRAALCLYWPTVKARLF